MSFLEKLYLYGLSYLLRVWDWIHIFLTRSLRSVNSKDVRIEHFSIPSRDPHRLIRAIRYTPKDVPVNAKLPVYLHWHASGWVLKRLGIDRHFCVRIASKLKCAVLECDYRKAPEHQYPDSHNDTEDAVAYVLANPQIFDTNRITVGGSSAGGNMALSLSARLGERIKGCFAMYPAVRIEPVHKVTLILNQLNTKFRSGVVIPNWVMKLFVRVYTKPDTNYHNDSRLSPILCDPSAFPKHVLMAIGDADTLYPSGLDFMKKISGSESGSNADQTRQFISVPNEAHEFNNFGYFRESREWRDRVEDAAIDMIRASWNM